jgi:hypothetical protein
MSTICGPIFANSPAEPGADNAPPKDASPKLKGLIPYFEAPSCDACEPKFNNPPPIAPCIVGLVITPPRLPNPANKPGAKNGAAAAK